VNYFNFRISSDAEEHAIKNKEFTKIVGEHREKMRLAKEKALNKKLQLVND